MRPPLSFTLLVLACVAWTPACDPGTITGDVHDVSPGADGGPDDTPSDLDEDRVDVPDAGTGDEPTDPPDAGTGDEPTDPPDAGTGDEPIDPPDAGTGDEPIDPPDAGTGDEPTDPPDAGTGDEPTDPPDAGSPSTWWKPEPGTSWQWQLSGTIDTSHDVAMYDIDLFDAPQAVIDGLQADGRVVICYFSAGSIEDWRDDVDDFPSEALGNTLDGWPDERWLDVRHPGVRAVMRARLDLAAARNCDGVEPDNVDGYTNAPGFPLTAADQLDYNRFLAAEAHARGLSIGLKNDLDQVPALVDDFDWALNEQCFEYDECDALQPFIDAGKAVFTVEYGEDSLADEICPMANSLDLDTLIKPYHLGPERLACR